MASKKKQQISPDNVDPKLVKQAKAALKASKKWRQRKTHDVWTDGKHELTKFAVHAVPELVLRMVARSDRSR